MAKIDGRADAFFNGEFFYIRTMSQGMLAYAEPDAEPHYLSPDATNENLGRVMRRALVATKLVTPTEFQVIYKSGVVQKVGDERNTLTMAKYGYKSKKAMYREMMCCWIELADGQVGITPTVHDSLDGYHGASKDGLEILQLPQGATDAELGAALREGFRRCTSEWP